MNQRSYIQDTAVRKRLFWFREADRLGVNRACQKLGIYKSHFYYWKQRLARGGPDGLANRSRRPHHSPRLSGTSLVFTVLALRAETQRGADTLALLLQQRSGQKISRSTIHKILRRERCVSPPRRRPKKPHPQRYQADRPGDRVQIDIKYVPHKVHDGTSGRAYQYTAIDDCTRVRFARIYDGRGICQLADFLPKMLDCFPFTVKVIQTDNDSIFTNKFTALRAFKNIPKTHWFKTFCQSRNIRHHLIEPGEPALNGKVERSHRTDQEQFYNHHRLAWLNPLQQKFLVWIDHYNHARPHWGILGQTPAQKLATFNLKLRRISHDPLATYSLAA